jgi:5-methylcytosine-specific restriction endonuclease McrA
MRLWSGSVELGMTYIPRTFPLRRTKPFFCAERRKPRPGRLTGAALKELRRQCYERDGGKCVECGIPLIYEPVHPLVPNGYHMAHIRARSLQGKDELSNVRSKCSDCHIRVEHSGGKPKAGRSQ